MMPVGEFSWFRYLCSRHGNLPRLMQLSSCGDKPAQQGVCLLGVLTHTRSTCNLENLHCWDFQNTCYQRYINGWWLHGYFLSIQAVDLNSITQSPQDTSHLGGVGSPRATYPFKWTNSGLVTQWPGPQFPDGIPPSLSLQLSEMGTSQK